MTTKDATLQAIGELVEVSQYVRTEDRDALLLIADVIRDLDTDGLRNTIRTILVSAGVPEERTWPSPSASA